MEKLKINHSNVYYPPGGILLWIIIFVELVTFGMALISMVYTGKQDPVLFHNARLQLNATYGAINTVLLLTSGFFMANVVQEVKQSNGIKAKRYLLLTMLFGFLFLVLKTVEYSEKINHGLVLETNIFFTYYWMLTLFHVIHVVVGLALLSFVLRTMIKEKGNVKFENVEASAAFWHMCDLIWLLLFPIIYLIF